jgi:hypothetical protein
MRSKLATTLAVVLIASICATQTTKNQPRMFAVKGNILGEKGSPVAFAWVCLKETRSRIFRMKRAGRDGSFSFTFLNAQLDYAIYAEREDLVSEKVLVSGSQKAPEVIVKLQLNGNQNSK